ncbi:MAG: GNAT family N-acetyltransferase [Actinomycetota bacterium]
MVATVRTARVEDGEAMGRIHVESWRAAYVGVVPQTHLDALDAQERGANWRAAIEANPDPDHGRRLVVEVDGEVVGLALVVADRDGEEGVGEIPLIYVHPTAWGTGAGFALMVECEAEMQRRGFTAAVLWVLEANPRARAFYERQGWFADGGRKIEEIGGVELAEIRYRRRFDD